MPRFRVQEWVWLGVLAAAIAVMGLVVLEPWLPHPESGGAGQSPAALRIRPKG